MKEYSLQKGNSDSTELSTIGLGIHFVISLSRRSDKCCVFDNPYYVYVFCLTKITFGIMSTQSV
jgi:hypothetical protein